MSPPLSTQTRGAPHWFAGLVAGCPLLVDAIMNLRSIEVAKNMITCTTDRFEHFVVEGFVCILSLRVLLLKAFVC